eukprot:TRINITY_DN9336_c0_g1_i1.p1 TRINITY_DN9336_c0_g1~~TRINITY_DN9336_c0_g1_i1.p1  ORF type:complete len:750 (+),score=163.08 TRINITY_DN9336_c0_g1_i1:79-2250(+)
MRALALVCTAAAGCSALDAQSVYEQLLAAPHAPGFFEANPIPVRRRRRPQRPVRGTSQGTYFASVFSDNAVLQRSPAKAALYGRVLTDGPLTTAQVTVGISPSVGGRTTFSTSVGSDGSWKVLLPAKQAGGNYTATAWCTNCGAAAGQNATMTNLTFGDVWFCSGQSNMQMPVEHSLDRNSSKREILAGRYPNIRIYTWPTIAVQDGQVDFIPIDKGGPWRPVWATEGGDEDRWFLDDFSAHCWHTFQELSHLLGEDVPLGLIESAWGGTEVQSWTPNATLDKMCTNLTGGPPNQATYPPNSGALWNGMVLPLVNMSIKGATWFQGENNCHECDVRCEDKQDCIDSTANTCGNILANAGYPCYLKTMIDSWRQAWSAVPGTTDPEFPFGVQTLQSTEGACGGGAFRSAQALNELVLPSPRHPKVFLAQGFDAQEPIGISNWPTGARGSRFQGIDADFSMECQDTFATPETGYWYGTSFMMGPIHPRSKRIVGRRMALAAAETAYGRTDLISVGPVLKNCSASGNGLVISFQEKSLKSDAVHVFPGMLPGYDLPDDVRSKRCKALPNGTASPFCSSFGGITPMEVRYTVPVNATANVSVWMPVSLRATSTNHIHTKCVKCTSPGQPKGCCVNYTKTDGWNQVETHIAVPPLDLPIPGTRLSDYITGVRYAWGASPCCPSFDRDQIACPPNSCPIRGWNSTLPANPFYAEIEGGQCKCAPPQQCS